MSAETQSDTERQTTGRRSGGDLARRDAQPAQLESDRGTTTIADGVVAKVVGIAAREVPGVYAMGAAPARALGRVTSQVGFGDDRAQGVSVEVGQQQAAADVTLVIDYGESVARVANDVRENVIRRIEGVCGLEVTEVNISVVDLHFPGDEQDQQQGEAPQRVE